MHKKQKKAPKHRQINNQKVIVNVYRGGKKGGKGAKPLKRLTTGGDGYMMTGSDYWMPPRAINTTVYVPPTAPPPLMIGNSERNNVPISDMQKLIEPIYVGGNKMLKTLDDLNSKVERIQNVKSPIPVTPKKRVVVRDVKIRKTPFVKEMNMPISDMRKLNTPIYSDSNIESIEDLHSKVERFQNVKKTHPPHINPNRRINIQPNTPSVFIDRDGFWGDDFHSVPSVPSPITEAPITEVPIKRGVGRPKGAVDKTKRKTRVVKIRPKQLYDDA
jgi:hypothetical protein